MIEIIRRYYAARKLVWPGAEDALLFFLSEIGELAGAYRATHKTGLAVSLLLWAVEMIGRIADSLVSGRKGWVRNGDRKKEPCLQDELADANMMLRVLAAETVTVDPDEALRQKMYKKGFDANSRIIGPNTIDR